MPKQAFMWFYSQARLEWLRLKAKDFEMTALQRSDLLPFVRDVDFGDTRKVYLEESLRIELVLGVWADFVFECNGKSTLYTSAIKPLTIDEAAEAMRDPFNQPDDEFPAYVQRNDGKPYLDILSTSVPQGVSVHFIMKPIDYDLLGNPGGYTQEDEAQQHQIVDLAVAKYQLSIENLNQYQGSRLEIHNSGS
ncbi:hypothetical protein [Dyadobacter sp. BHUBP1]|uniref:hypothetical protein n=1 Tax=Dyadobacter sp. BHUBP1 TaxID=3424178 RepID=UPI003D325EC8